jgi:hypothetical protein
MVYLTKSVTQAVGLDETVTTAQRDHSRRLHAELQITPCSPRCGVWLLYGIAPQGARHSMTPGHCRGKAPKLEHLGIAGRRVLVSRKWLNKTLNVPLCSTSTRIAQRVSAGHLTGSVLMRCCCLRPVAVPCPADRRDVGARRRSSHGGTYRKGDRTRRRQC